MSQNSIVNFLKAFPVTSVITAVNIAVYVYCVWNGKSWAAPDYDVLVELGASRRDRIWEGESWRFLTPMFLHGDIAHIAINSYFMLGLCATVEKFLGPVKFAVCYLLLGIGASAVSVLCHDATSVGASGAAFGILGILFSFFYRRLGSFQAFFNNPMIRRSLMFIVVLTAIGFYANFDNFAHLGGLGFGFLLGLILTWTTSSQLRLSALTGFMVLLSGAVYAAANHWPGQETRWAYEIYNEGIPYRKSGELDRALERFNTSERYGNRRPKLYVYRGELYLEMGRVDEGIRDLKRGLLDGAIEPADRSHAEFLLERAKAVRDGTSGDEKKPEPPQEP